MDGNIVSVISSVGGAALTAYGLKDILSELYRDSAQPGVRKIGIALETILGYGTNILTFYGEKQKMLIQKRLNQYAEKLESVTDERIVPVPPELGIPIFQRLSYYATADDLANLFLELLSRASVDDTYGLVQPSFISIIERMSIDEAKILKYIAENNRINIYFSIVTAQGMAEHLQLTPPITGIEKQLILDHPKNINIYFENLISLRIIENANTFLGRDLSEYLKMEKLYGGEKYFKDKYGNSPEIIQHQAQIMIIRGSYRITSMGLKFIECCVGKKIEDSYKAWGL